MAMYGRIKSGAIWQYIRAVKMFPRFKDTGNTLLQTNFHLAIQNKAPLWCPSAMKLAAKTHWTDPQLVPARRKYIRQHRLWTTVIQRDCFFAKPGATISIGKQNNFNEMGHGLGEGSQRDHYSTFCMRTGREHTNPQIP